MTVISSLPSAVRVPSVKSREKVILQTSSTENKKEENLTFIGSCISNIFQYISNKMQRYAVYLYLETALHVSGGTSTHHQERIQLYLQHLVFVTPLLLSVAIAAGSSNFYCNVIHIKD
jgi:hypothetical protein